MNRRSVLWITGGVLSFLWIGMLALSPSTTTQHLVSGTVSIGVVWALRGVIHRRRLSQVLLEGALYGAGAGWFWAAWWLKTYLPALTEWAARTLTPSLTLGLAVAPMVLGFAHFAYRSTPPRPVSKP